MNAYQAQISRSEGRALPVIADLNAGITIDYEAMEALDDAGRDYVRREVSIVEVPGDGYRKRVFTLWSATEDECGHTIAHREPLSTATTDLLRGLIAKSIVQDGAAVYGRDEEGCKVCVETHDEYDA